MAEKLGEGLLTALEERPVSISVEAKKKAPTSGKKASSQFGRLEHVLLAGSDPEQTKEARQDEVAQRFTDFGLGRGVDATRAKPWLNKTSFQVRPLRFGKLMGTEQGGSVEAYEDVVNSVQTLQLELKQSVSVSSAPVNIGTDGEHTRSTSNMRHVVGRRVHNRTISFREEFDEIPFAGSRAQPTTRVLLAAEGEEAQPQKMAPQVEEEPTFEEKLAKWVLERLCREGKCDSAMRERVRAFGDESPVVIFEKWFEGVPPAEHADTLKQIYELCLDFVKCFHVTHYVSSLNLGALEYSVITEEDYSREMGLAGSFGLEDVVSVVLKPKGKYSLRKTRKSTRVKRVGLIKNPDSGDYYVPRGTYAEAVIGVEVKPIQLLVRHQYLRRSLRHAVAHYIEEQRDTSVGPFFITSDSIDRETVYLSVNEKDMSLQATANKKEASEFFILMTDEGRNVHEFHIVYVGKSGIKGLNRQPTRASFGRSQRGTAERQPPHHYLSTPLSVIGSNNGPLHFELNPKKHHTMFVLHSRLRTRGAPAEALTPWVQGREEYFINCYSRKFARDGYLAVQRVQEGEVVQYQPVCVPSRRSNDDYFKVFSLVVSPTAGPPPTVVELESSPYPRRALAPIEVSRKETEDGMEMHSM